VQALLIKKWHIDHFYYIMLNYQNKISSGSSSSIDK